MMRSSVYVSSLICILSLAACSSASTGAGGAEPGDDAAEAATSKPLDKFGLSLVGKYADGGAPGATKEFETLALLRDGTYQAVVVSTSGAKKSEAGKFTAVQASNTLTLKPRTGASRKYVIELSEDFSSLTLARGTKLQYLISATPVECVKDADCGAGKICDFTNDGKKCAPATPPVTPPDAGPPPATDTCATRRGGAFITFEVAGEKLKIWSTNSSFIDSAKIPVAPGEFQKTPNFGKVLDGRDCDAQYSWHVDPADMNWADFTIELCDGTPSYLENNKASWMSKVGNYCPWGPKILKVEDRR